MIAVDCWGVVATFCNSETLFQLQGTCQSLRHLINSSKWWTRFEEECSNLFTRYAETCCDDSQTKWHWKGLRNAGISLSICSSGYYCLDEFLRSLTMTHQHNLLKHGPGTTICWGPGPEPGGGHADVVEYTVHPGIVFGQGCWCDEKACSSIPSWRKCGLHWHCFDDSAIIYGLVPDGRIYDTERIQQLRNMQAENKLKKIVSSSQQNATTAKRKRHRYKTVCD